MNPIQLNPKQLKTVELMHEFIHSGEDVFYFLGYAGSGKTLTISHFIKEIEDDPLFSKIKICAPTHQALNVLEDYFKKKDINTNRVIFNTIHKLLKYKPIIQIDSGMKVFKSLEPDNTKRKRTMDLIVIDECSMVSCDMIQELNLLISLAQGKMKVIYLGDPAQLPPVSEPISEIFAEIPDNYRYSIKLDQNMRSNADVIMKVNLLVRQWDYLNKPNELMPKLINQFNTQSQPKVFKLNKQSRPVNQSIWFKNLIKKIQQGYLPIILTWRNITCANYNNEIRKVIHQAHQDHHLTDEYIANDYIIFNDFYQSLDEEPKPFYTATLVKIINVKTSQAKLTDWLESRIKNLVKPTSIMGRAYEQLLVKLDHLTPTLNISEFKVQSKEGNQGGQEGNTLDLYTIQAINRSELNIYHEALKQIKNHIQHFFQIHKKEKLVNALWSFYYAHMITPYANINYGYAITTHKAQGSTFDHVIVDVDDIYLNQNRDEMVKALYTAVGRASKELVLIV